jgi:exopolysaccharide biosynthesis protein
MILNHTAILLLAASPAPPPASASPILVEAIARETPDGPVHAWIAKVDLTDPRVSFVVTGPLEQRDGVPARAEAFLAPTDVWAEKEGVDLAVNGGFFARVDGQPGGPGRWTDGLPVDIVGLSRSDGRTVSPSRQGGRDVALLVDETFRGQSCPCTVRAGDAGDHDLDGVEDAVAGGSSRDGDPGTPLVVNGENRGATAQVEPDRRHPRTAAGVSRDGRTLVLLVVDGRQPAWSIGATLPELAQMMIEAGAWNAVNLDGGGSSALWHREPGAPAGRVLNHPSDGQVRPAANHLGVRVSVSPVGTSSKR